MKFENGKEVLVVESRDEHHLKDALEHIMRDSDTAEAIGTAAQYALTQKQYKGYIDETTRIYSSLLE